MMSTKSHIRPLLSLALPVAASQVSDMLVMVSDAIMVGPLGAVPLAGVSLAGAVSAIAMLFAVGFTVAITPLAGEAYGRRSMADVALYVRMGTISSMAITIIITGLLLAFSSHLDLLGASADVTAQAVPYFRWIIASVFFRIVFGCFKQTAEAMANTRVSMIINVATNVINVFLNWVFIYGELGMPEMGAEGAGFATFLARGLAAFAAIALFITMPFFKQLRSAAHPKVGWATQRKALLECLSNGLGIGVQILVEVLAFTSGVFMLGRISATAVAAHQIAMNLASTTFMVALGLGSAATIRVSNFLGNSRPTDARLTSVVALGLVTVYMACSAVAYLLLRHQLPHLFVNDEAVIDLTARLLLFCAVFSVFDGLQVVSMGILRGYNDIRVPAMIATVGYLVISIPVGYVCTFVLNLGAQGIWIGYVVGLFLASFGYLLRLRSVMNRQPQTAASAHVHA